MKRILWGGFLVILLAACGTNQPDLPQATNTFNFSVDPSAQSVEFAATSATGLIAQAEDGSRVLVPGTDLSLEKYTFAFLPGNVLAIDANFRNVSGKTLKNLTFSRAAGSSGVVSSTEPSVVARLNSGESTGTLRFTVQHRGQPFTYAVEARVTVEETGGADCTDPVNIPDRTLREGIRIQLEIPEGDEITCADMSGLAELDFLELRFKIDPREPESVRVSNLEGLQFAVNLDSLVLLGGGSNKDLIQPLSGLASLTQLGLLLRVTDGVPSNDFENFYNLSYLGNLTNLTRLKVSAFHTDYSWISGLNKLINLDLSFNEFIADLSFFRTLPNLTEFNLLDNRISDVGPLVENEALGGNSDIVDLSQNCLDLSPGSQASQDINTIESRNPNVQNVLVDNQKSDEVCGQQPPPPPEPTNLQVVLDGTPKAVVGELVTYLVSAYRFDGPPATGVKLKADFALPVMIDSVQPNASCTVKQVEDSYRLECDLNLNEPTPDSAIFLSVKTSKAGTFSASATISSNETDSDPANNTSTFDVEVFENGNTCTNLFGIPDSVLESSVRKALNKPEGDITCADMASLTELDARELDEIYEPDPVISLEGLQFATNLTSLSFYIPFPTAEYFEPLSGLTTLERLTISNFYFPGDDYPNIDMTFLSDLTNLTYLSLPTSQVGDLSVLAGLTNLTELFVPSSNAADYSPLSGLTKLVRLDLSSNFGVRVQGQVTDLSFLERLTALDDLNLYGNLITDLNPLVANPGIGEGDDRIDLSLNCLNTSPDSQASKDAATIERRNPDVVNIIGFDRQLDCSEGE